MPPNWTIPAHFLSEFPKLVIFLPVGIPKMIFLESSKHSFEDMKGNTSCFSEIFLNFRNMVQVVSEDVIYLVWNCLTVIRVIWVSEFISGIEK